MPFILQVVEKHKFTQGKVYFEVWLNYLLVLCVYLKLSAYYKHFSNIIIGSKCGTGQNILHNFVLALSVGGVPWAWLKPLKLNPVIYLRDGTMERQALDSLLHSTLRRIGSVCLHIAHVIPRTESNIDSLTRTVTCKHLHRRGNSLFPKHYIDLLVFILKNSLRKFNDKRYITTVLIIMLSINIH